MNADDIAATLDEELLERARTIQQRPSETIVPARRTPDTESRRAMSVLSSLAAEAGTDLTAAIELERTIGEGGMGVVRLGTQVALGRKVAVKSLRNEVSGDAATLKMLREAWITGSLEHPNVVPIYDVGLDAEGRPLIVLKRIEGTEWSALVGNERTVKKRFGASDLLEWNLGIFDQVCNAVRFAHARGILHRDLKPENVMIGEFGEVYVLDWGIAVSLSDDGSGRLALASDATDMAGTPHYMAPEMLGGKKPNLSERTDVYLLGSILHEIVAGAPPHDGDNVMGVISSIMRSPPGLPDHAPPELARIVRRAMEREPDARFENVEQLRLAVTGFLRHRGSRVLADEALARLEHLRGYIAAAEAEDALGRQRIYNLFSECRFGFKSALDSWRENEVAAEGLCSATIAMVDFELAQGDPRAAAALAAQLDSVSHELTERISVATREKEAADRELAALAEAGRQEDQSVGRRTRAFLAWTLGLFWTVMPLWGHFAGAPEEATWEMTFWWTGGIFAVVLAAGIWARESLLKTAFNRRVCGGVLVAIAGELALHVGNVIAGIDPAVSQAQAILIIAIVEAYAVVAIDRRLIALPILTFGCYLLGALHLELRFLALAGASAVLLGHAVWLWRFRREDVAIAQQGLVRRRDQLLGAGRKRSPVDPR